MKNQFFSCLRDHSTKFLSFKYGLRASLLHIMMTQKEKKKSWRLQRKENKMKGYMRWVVLLVSMLVKSCNVLLVSYTGEGKSYVRSHFSRHKGERTRKEKTNNKITQTAAVDDYCSYPLENLRASRKTCLFTGHWLLLSSSCLPPIDRERERECGKR